MGALKRGHVLADGVALAGDVTVATLGIEVAAPGVEQVEDLDLALVPPLARDEHKWRRALVVIAGSPGMLGAPALVCDGAFAVQAGMVLACAPNVARDHDGSFGTEVVRLTAGADEVAKVAGDALGRASALVVGPGLGRSSELRTALVESSRRRPCRLSSTPTRCTWSTSTSCGRGSPAAPAPSCSRPTTASTPGSSGARQARTGSRPHSVRPTDGLHGPAQGAHHRRRRAARRRAHARHHGRLPGPRDAGLGRRAGRRDRRPAGRGLPANLAAGLGATCTGTRVRPSARGAARRRSRRDRGGARDETWRQPCRLRAGVVPRGPRSTSTRSGTTRACSPAWSPRRACARS